MGIYILLAALSCCFAVVLIVSEYSKPRRLLWKTLASAMFTAAAVIALVFTGDSPFYQAGIAIGLICSMAGDEFLAVFDNKRKNCYFVWGVVFFSLAQIFYAVYFVGLALAVSFGVLLVTLLVFIGAMGGIHCFRMELGRVHFPVIVYSLLLSFSFACALLSALEQMSGQAWLMAAGMALFLLSDVVLLFKYFLIGAHRSLTGLNLSLYYGAQALLVVGMAMGGIN